MPMSGRRPDAKPAVDWTREFDLPCPGIPRSREGERPTAYADRVGEWCIGRICDRQRKTRGIYLTPVQAADFMSGRIAATGRRIRILDPAAGAGILCCVAVEALVSRQRKPDMIELVTYEVVGDLIPPLRAVLDYLARWCRDRHGTAVRVRIEAEDFILTNADAVRRGGLFSSCAQTAKFDVVIANPPYFKIGKSDPRAIAVPAAVHGQPNIYALLMAVGAALLRSGGGFVLIIPRSFASGPYFRRFRAVFFDMVRPTRIHVFDSRRDAFRRDEVLQENVILSGTRQDRWHENGARANLVLSSSPGVAGIDDAESRELPVGEALDLASRDRILRLPICDTDDRALTLVDSWSTSLHGLGLNVSTGPVVPFRATGLVAREGKVPASHAPLLWMNHVRAMRATWPLNRHKPEYIERAGAETLLVPNRNYVLLRRFSAKEEARRLTAAPWIAADLSIADIGLENHLNYVHRPGGMLSEDEAWGLAALYNSHLLDTWFRAINGNTQVSATELRAMPLPDHDSIVALGQRVKHRADPLAGLDALVASVVASRVLKEAAVG